MTINCWIEANPAIVVGFRQVLGTVWNSWKISRRVCARGCDMALCIFLCIFSGWIKSFEEVRILKCAEGFNKLTKVCLCSSCQFHRLRVVEWLRARQASTPSQTC